MTLSPRAWRLPAVLSLLLLPGLGAASLRPADQALLIVRLPADAQLLVDGEATHQTGAQRTFITPTLAVGTTYRYQLSATWTRDGKPVRSERTVRFTAGQRLEIDFTTDPLPAQARSRSFEFTYQATVTGLDAGKRARLWVPMPSTSDDQDVQLVASKVQGASPVAVRFGSEPRYGNRMAFAETIPGADGKVTLHFVYRITRREVKGETGTRVKEDMKRLARFLEADALVPIDGKPLELLRGKELPDDPMRKARVLYDVVNQHMKYSKAGEGWGRGDSTWACDSKFGNCSDFHSLFISLARAQKMPAKFEIGFPLPARRGNGTIGGYHCWAFFRPEGKGWVPVDISEANKDPKMTDYYFGNLTEDRVTFSTGRDLDLVPRQADKPLNFFIYPYVEVDGKEHPQAKINKQFTFRDVP